jgi:thioredoxin-dependent peroxiredoxin
MSIGVGDPAPVFEAQGTDGSAEGRRSYSLGEYRGQPVVLVFYPADHSPVCTVQLTTYSHDIGQFSGLGAQLLALSPQSVDEHEAFGATNGGFAFPLLADEDKSIAEAYAILGPLGFYRRSVFVVDGDGIIRYVHRAAAGRTFRSTDEIVAAVEALDQ